MKLSIVIPAYNEEENIESAVRSIARHFKDAEIVVVNDCSTDKTLQILEKLQKEIKDLLVLTNEVNSGHGTSVVNGLMAATRDYILYIDADQQIELSNFLCSPKLDFISGYRVDRKDKPFRLVITRILKFTNLVRHGYYIKDANCPFKIYKRSSLRMMISFLPKSRVIPIACLEVLARRYHFKTAEIPVLHNEYHASRVGFLQTINRRSIAFCWAAFKEVIRL